jgi:hypothetical protein
MSSTVNNVTAWRVRTVPKDVGVAILVVVALALGWLLRSQVEGRTHSFTSANPPLTMSYPATWRNTASLDGALLRVENAQTASAYKTNMTIDSRELDPASPPTLQELVDRRIVQHGNLTGYHLLSSAERDIQGARSGVLDYAYVVQPIDTPRSASLPVVVHAREYVVPTKDRTYYFTLAAPESEFARASEEFDRSVEGAKLQ